MARNCTDVAEAVLTSFDTSMNNAWREEEEEWHAQDREWHQQDLQWTSSLRLSWAEERAARNSKCRWREEDMVQRNLENARCLWLRFVERNRRDVEEKSEQLKAISNLAALFAGFAIVTLTQFSVQEPYSMVLVSLYGVLTALVECLMTISMVTCTLILGCILKIGKTYVNEQAEEEFIFQCLEFCQNYHEGDHPPCPKRTLEVFWECRCESSWQRAFLCFSLDGTCIHAPLRSQPHYLSPYWALQFSSGILYIIVGVNMYGNNSLLEIEAIFQEIVQDFLMTGTLHLTLGQHNNDS